MTNYEFCTIEKDRKGNIIEITMWHPVNGKWTHIKQCFKKGETQLFTNGRRVMPPIELSGYIGED